MNKQTELDMLAEELFQLEEEAYIYKTSLIVNSEQEARMEYIAARIKEIEKLLPKSFSYDDIRQNPELKEFFFEEFKQTLAACDETLLGFSEFSDQPDADYVLDIFENQGYWVGVQYNIHFNFELGFEYEERRFG